MFAGVVPPTHRIEVPASEDELMDIEGIGEARASSIKEGLTQLAATTGWDR